MARVPLTLALLLLLSVSAVAQVSTPDPPATDDAPIPDTELTPQGQRPPETQWSLLGGAKFDGDGELFSFNGAPSPTPYTVDFFTTAFAPDDPATDVVDSPVGFFAGAECINEQTPFDKLEEECDGEDGEGRRPAIYRYSVDELGEQRIERMDLVDPNGSDADRLGFVGAVAWIDPERALAVGGDGKYPRREPEPQPGGDAGYAAYDRDHWAGKARAWLYEDPDGAGPKPSAWRELDLPDAMGALTALDCARQDLPGGIKKGTCFAGGLQQVWRWHPPGPDNDPEEGFDATASVQSGTPLTVAGQGCVQQHCTPDFHFRVRQIRVASDQVLAVTSGCCAKPEPEAEATGAGTLKGARVLTTTGSKWSVEPFSLVGAEDASSRGGPLAESYYGVVVGQGSGSYTAGALGSSMSAIASPGDERTAGSAEPGSRVVLRVTTGPSNHRAFEDRTDRALDEVRLLAADGDYQATFSPAYNLDGSREKFDGMFDWAVGRFKDSEQGVAYTTVPSVLPLPSPFTCKPLAAETRGQFQAGNAPCEPEPSNVTEPDVGSNRLLRMGTYALNALTFVPASNGSEAWAAGDRGALARLGGGGRLGGAREPDAPALEVGEPAALSERGPFDPFRAQLGQARSGVVPPLADRPLERLAEETLVPWGTPDASLLFWDRRVEQVASIAMSRDGSEGWAVGTPNQGSGSGVALQHFTGERWARCDPDGLRGAYAPDPACESLRPLLDNPGVRRLTAVARVPLEHGDPSNDDEFAAIAVGINVVLRYERGKWSHDVDASKVISTAGQSPVARVAFRRGDDGWMVTNAGSGTLFRYVGDDWPDGRWVNCTSSPPPACGDVSLFPTSETGGSRGSILDVRVAGDTVFAAGTRTVSGSGSVGARYPFVLKKKGDGPWEQDYDPGCPPPSAPPNDCPRPPDPDAQVSSLFSFSVVDVDDGKAAGWLFGKFGRPGSDSDSLLIRRDPDWDPESAEAGSSPWTPRTAKDVADDFIRAAGQMDTPPRLIGVRGADGGERAFIMPSSRFGGVHYPPLEYDPDRDRWEVMRAPFVSSANRSGSSVRRAAQGEITAVGPDERGGIWVAAESSGPVSADPDAYPATGTYFYRLADERHRAVFEDAASPIAEPITGMAGNASGDVWVSTASNRVYHYDRFGGWERVSVAGWDPGRVVTRPSQALAVAVNEAGVGIVVGEDGRIADLSPRGVVLDRASGRRCSDVSPPCGTPRDLRAAAVASDGSAIAGGENMALVWRPAGGPFRTIAAPPVLSSTRVTGVSMPVPGRAWVTLSQGEIWAGTLDGERWRWVRESDTEAARDEGAGAVRFARLYAIKVQADGRGLAVGFRGAMLERSPDGVWRRIKTGFVDNLHSISFPPGGYGDGTLVGGAMGVILTRINGRYYVARHADFADPVTIGGGTIVGLAMAGGRGDGDVEAWAASQVDSHFPTRVRTPPPHALLHYGSGDPLLDPEARARALPDTPAAEPDEVTLAAFGRSECQFDDCPPFQGTNLFNEVIARRIQAELRKRRERAPGAFAALFTGDIDIVPGRDEESRKTAGAAEIDEPNVAHYQWRELFARPLLTSGVPLFGALGKKDLSRARVCWAGLGCEDPQDLVDAGASSQWRETFSGMARPWGDGADVPTQPGAAGELEVVQVADAPTSVPAVDQSVQPDPSLPAVEVRAGARTHYALDLKRRGERLARLVFIDNSVARSLSASDPGQNPLEADGQTGWLERVLCLRDQTCAGIAPEDAREPEQPAVVVSNAPTYSYGPGGLDAVQADGSVLESILLRHRATAVVSGRLGWNGLFYTLGAGLHWPCPGGEYPGGPPDVSKGQGRCSQAGDQAGGAPEPPPVSGAGEAAESLRGLGAPVPAQLDPVLRTADGLRDAIPNVVASTAGGRFGPRGTDSGSAREGYWHGYSVLRVRGQGEVIVEQRPILDWVGIEAQEHTLRPGQRVTLRGYGREPYGTDTSFRGYQINSPAVTHRYDLVIADPEKPYLPLEDANGDYVPVPAQIATIDRNSGAVRAGKGNRERTYTIGILSVGDKAATWPLVFEPRRSFVAQRSRLVLPAIPRPARAPAAQPPLRIGDALAPPPTTPPATPTSPLTNQTIQTPQPPTLPTLPGVTATAPPPAPTLTAPPPPPPPPPAPPVPPQQQPQPLALGAKVQAVAIVPSVNPPAPPPVNPAPPGGAAARKEAKQRQAAVAKSEEGGEDAVDPSDAQAPVNATDSPDTYTRPDGARSDRYSFTAISRTAEASPLGLGRGALYGGGMTLMALALALGWTIGRPSSRRREPPVPAPSWARRTR